MSADEEINAIYLLKQISRQQEAHITASNNFREEMKTTLAQIETKGVYTAKALTEHDIDIDELKTAHNKQKGAVWVFGIIGLRGLVELIKQWVR